jgi:type II secretory pathway component GspD/PulD (secretin)
VATSQTRSVVNLASDRTVLLGTYERCRTLREETGVFLLRSIPLLGGLFRREVTTQRTSRVIVLVTPRLRDARDTSTWRTLVPPALHDRIESGPAPVGDGNTR